jgi:stage V sporulation protein G
MGEDSIQVSRIYRLEGDSKTKAFVDVAFDGIVVKGLRIVEGKNGLFLSMPRHQGKDGKWYETVFPVTKEARQNLSDTVLAAYRQ